ncbi:hypothetical protein AAVH_26987 [Aphelenchoides avenae]|nr:hypothetical protein AAVH_26987 [Aphelenchus avenae]
MKAPILLFAFIACVAAYCPHPGHFRHFVYAKGHAKAITYKHEDTKGLRVELVSYPADGDPRNATVLAGANADDSGFYVIAGSAQVGCLSQRKFALRLYADALAKYPLLFGIKRDVMDVPQEYVTVDDHAVKLFEKDLEGRLRIIS